MHALTSPDTSQQSWRLHGALLIGLLLIAMAAHAPVTADMVDIWWRSGTFNHCFLIPVISVWLIAQRREKLALLTPRASFIGLLGVAAASLLMLVATLVNVAAAQHFALVLLIQTLVWAVLGDRIAWSLLFPLLYLWFAVPFGEFLVPRLQDLTADMTVALLKVWGMPVFVEDRMIQIPGGNFQVAEACSGINYLIASLALGTLYAYLQFHRFSRRLLFVALALIVPILANGLRAFGIILIAYYSDMQYAVGVDHLIYGWLFFGVVMLLLFSLGRLFSDAPLAEKTAAHAAPASARKPWWPATVGGLLIGFSAALAHWPVSHEAPVPQAPSLPQDFQRVDDNPLGSAFAGASGELAFRAGDGADSRFVYLAWFPFDSEGRELISGNHRHYDDERFRRIGTQTITLGDKQYRAIRLRDAAAREWLLLTLNVLPASVPEQDWQVKLQQLWARLARQDLPAAALQILMPADEGVDTAADTQTVQAVVDAVQERLRS